MPATSTTTVTWTSSVGVSRMTSSTACSSSPTPAARSRRVAVFASNGQNTGHVKLADLDCDGLLDAVATNNDSGTVSILPGTGGGFGAPAITSVGISPDEIAIADMDADGDLDVATANRDSNSLSVITNQSDCGAPINPDVDGDGVVGFGDLVSVLSAWGACSGCPQDVDGDGMVGFSDITTILAAWG